MSNLIRSFFLLSAICGVAISGPAIGAPGVTHRDHSKNASANSDQAQEARARGRAHVTIVAPVEFGVASNGEYRAPPSRHSDHVVYQGTRIIALQ